MLLNSCQSNVGVTRHPLFCSLWISSIRRFLFVFSTANSYMRRLLNFFVFLTSSLRKLKFLNVNLCLYEVRIIIYEIIILCVHLMEKMIYK
jgi:hypothetical protein